MIIKYRDQPSSKEILTGLDSKRRRPGLYVSSEPPILRDMALEIDERIDGIYCSPIPIHQVPRPRPKNS